MGFLKFQADRLFTGTTMLTGKQVLICDDYGVVQQIVDEQDGGDDIKKLDGILSPGFINCHCHLELSHMRSLIPEKTGLIDFVFSIVTQRHFPDEEILEAIANAENEMLQNGIVAVGDISNNLLTLEQKRKQNLTYYNFVESSGWLPSIADQRFLNSKRNLEAFSEISASSMVPHAPYSVSNNLWKLLKQGFSGKTISIHNQETAFEDELFIQNSGDFVRMYQLMKLDTSFYTPSGKSSLQTYFHHLHDAASVILVHNTFIRQADIDFVKSSRPNSLSSFCLCINANKFIEDAVPPIQLLRKNDCNIVIGTDSLASNWSLSILDELVTIQQNFPSISLEELLRWSTYNGAAALQVNNTLGSFEKGKKPGVVLLQNVEENDFLGLATVKKLA